MVKKTAVFLVLLIAAGGLFAQEITIVENEKPKNTAALSFGFIGVEGSYERQFNNYLSVLVDASYTTLVLMDEFTASVKGRWYPFGKTFYLDLGLGYSYGYGTVNLMKDMILTTLTFGWWLTQIDYDNIRTGGFLIQPGLGWKIDVGKPGAFVLPIGMGLDFKIGPEIPDVTPFFRIGLGYSF